MDGTRMLQRRGSAAEWAASNPVLGDGEIGWERDTGKMKFGNGVDAWNVLPYGSVPPSLLQALGDLLVATGPGAVARLPRGATGQRLVVMADGTLAWQTSGAIQASLVDAKGDLIVATAADTVARLARGATGQRLSVQADGSLAWVDMPDLSGFETIAHAVATYADKTAAAQQVFAGAGGVKATNGLWDGVNRVYSAGNPQVVAEQIRFHISGQPGATGYNVILPKAILGKAITVKGVYAIAASGAGTAIKIGSGTTVANIADIAGAALANISTTVVSTTGLNVNVAAGSYLGLSVTTIGTASDISILVDAVFQ